MKRQILLLAITAAALSSCTTAYKTAQTPDDVYFSPAKPQDEYVRAEEDDEYRYNDDYYDDRYLRMKVQNRTSRWNSLDDWYAYDRYSYRYNYYYGSYYNPYTSWNYYYNPYCHNNVIIYNPKQSGVVANVPKPRSFNLASYTNTAYNNANNNVNMRSKPGSVNRPVYNNTNSNRSFSNTVKQIVGGNNNNRNNDNSSSNSSTRTYSPSNSNSSSSSSSSSGSSSGSSGSSSGASRPSRGN